MADIDKPLSTVVPFPVASEADDEMDSEEIEVEIADPTDPYEEGEAEFEDDALPADHFANLAEVMDDDELSEISSDLIEKFEKDKGDRADWEKAYTEGLDLLGFKHEDVSEPWDGASGVYHPLLTEAVIRFQSQTIMEVYPASGPVRTKIVGTETPEIKAQAKRVEADLNYQITEKIPDYREELEMLLFNLPLAGSAFKKLYFDEAYKTINAKYVPADDFIVPYGASNLKSAPHYTHIISIHSNAFRRSVAAGVYMDIDAIDLEGSNEHDDVDDAKDSASLEINTGNNGMRTLLEIHADYDLGEHENIDLPYIFTIDKDSGKILSIRRNWREGDDNYERLMHFVHYPYIPGLGFYGLGLIHIIGGIAKASTSVLRQLLDAGTLANLPGGMKTRGLRIVGDGSPINPGEWRDVDVVAGSLQENIMPLPYKEPSAVLAQLLSALVDEGKRLGSMADIKITDMSSQAPVGTTLALIERATKIISAVHARVHAGIKNELRLIAELVRDNASDTYEYQPEDFPFTRSEDYSDKIDVIPVSDPNASTMAQRVVTQQAILDLARQSPDIYDMPALHRQSLEVLGAKNVEKLVPLPDEDMKPQDPITENMSFINQRPTKAFAYQDHQAHIQLHMDFLNNPSIRAMVGQSPNAAAIQAGIEAHIAEHLAYHYRDMIEKHMGAPLPPLGEPLPPEIEKKLSSLVVEASRKLMREEADKAEAERVSELVNDPVTQLQMRDIALKEKKFSYEQQRDLIDDVFKKRELDIREEKIESDEKIAGMRAAIEAGTKQTVARINAAMKKDK
jgi:hypothetical protein